MEPQVPNDILIKIYEQFGDLRSDVAATKSSTEANSMRLEALIKQVSSMESKISNLEKGEAQNRLKWGIATFLTTALVVSGIDYAMGDVERPEVLAPTTKEIVKDPLWPDPNDE